MARQTSLIHAERHTEQLRHGYQIGPDGDRKWPPSVQNSLPNGIKKWSPRSHSDVYHCRRTSHGGPEDYQEPYRTKPLTETLTEWRTEGSKTIAEWHTELNAKPPYQRPTKWLPRNKRIFYRSCLPRWPQGEASQPDPTKCWIKRCRNLHMQCTKRLSESRSALLSRLVWPPSVKLMC